jgi:hypothetical protein
MIAVEADACNAMPQAGLRIGPREAFAKSGVAGA